LAESAKETIKQWINEAVAEVLTTELKSKIMQDAKKALHKEIQDIVRNKTNEYNLRHMADPIIEGWFNKVADEVRRELGVNERFVKEEN
jgi:ribosomal protein S3AE